ncbi:DUF5719 family protein [Streptomyces tsukubensis]|uniref:Secreted protein n=1 Tax=Streptomyces tsukubensis (strain DSM 42081 / NBRC 108919 / NRRL 18488 / 9993) TaxID=1114943 RepID=A0A7G3UGI9_STRT9|nr:DUF5719 family protein [Streptomyces tsukubensis]AZK94340.1 hypothetical protein B7R87_11070 [Streptomyces tsukubensis]QKM69567.1 hypothetical protein STSU_022720 [Streptomyces tsukubensis NRRL18488]TAI42505.1 hypothetical protein EWI31_18810 [Streptomyces tsukubensis]
MKRTTQSLLAAVAALTAITGLAALTAPGAREGDAGAKAPVRMPVERSILLCPSAGTSEAAGTLYTSFTPTAPASPGDPPGGSGGPSGKPAPAPVPAAGTAELRPAGAPVPAPEGAAKLPKPRQPRTATADGGPRDAAPGAGPAPVLTAGKPGAPLAVRAGRGEAPALVGTATAALAPGWTTQQTTVLPSGPARGLLGTTCTAPDTGFWFPGVSTAEGRQDYLHLTNPDDTPAVADIEIHGRDGQAPSSVPDGIPVPAGSGIPVLLSTVTPAELTDATLRVTVRTGRVGAVVRAAEDTVGSDWLAASAEASATAVLPGIPADATSVRLIAFAPGESDAELKIRLAGPRGTIVPAGHESVRVKAGTVTSVDLKGVTRGEAGSLLLDPAEPDRPTPFVAALRVVRGTGTAREVAYIPAAGPVGDRASTADNRSTGTTLTLAAPTGAARVRVTVSPPGPAGAAPSVRMYTVAAGTTLAVVPAAPGGPKSTYALTVETVSGGPVHAARTLAPPLGPVRMFTVQTLSDDRANVPVPEAERDLSVLDD